MLLHTQSRHFKLSSCKVSCLVLWVLLSSVASFLSPLDTHTHTNTYQIRKANQNKRNQPNTQREFLKGFSCASAWCNRRIPNKLPSWTMLDQHRTTGLTGPCAGAGVEEFGNSTARRSPLLPHSPLLPLSGRQQSPRRRAATARGSRLGKRFWLGERQRGESQRMPQERGRSLSPAAVEARGRVRQRRPPVWIEVGRISTNAKGSGGNALFQCTPMFTLMFTPFKQVEVRWMFVVGFRWPQLVLLHATQMLPGTLSLQS